MAEYQAGELALRSLAGKLISDFAIHTYGAKFLGEFERQDETLAGKCDLARSCNASDYLSAGFARKHEIPFPGFYHLRRKSVDCGERRCCRSKSSRTFSLAVTSAFRPIGVVAYTFR